MEVTFENPCPGQANGLPAYYFTQAVQMLIATHCTIGNPEDYPKDRGNFSDSLEFDFIVVGGGSSGSVIADRLSEIKKWKILVLETGGDPTFESDIPSFGFSLPGRDLDWKFETNRSDSACLGMESETCAIFQGKVLGGTSTINKMHYIRGNPDDYDNWKTPGWEYETVLKYFKKSEKLDEDFKIVNDADFDEGFKEIKNENDDGKLYELSKMAAGKFHSKTGSMSVNYFAYDYFTSEVKKALFDGAEEVNISHIADINRRFQPGFVRSLGCIHEGNRGNAAKAFLSPIKNRGNLFVVKNATVVKLTSGNGVVTGVKYLKNGEVRTIKAKKEVIVAAGAINTPRLLLLSGIGPKEHLEKVGVELLKDLPGVGKNLQAHLTFFGFPVALKEMSKSVTHLQKIDAMYRFISRGTGVFGSVGMNDVVGFIATKNETAPDVQILHYLNHARDYYTFNELLISLKIKNQIRDQFSKAYAKSAVLLLCPTIMQPKSRGEVQLTGPKFRDPVRINANFLTNQQDVRTLIEGIRFGVELTHTKTFEKFRPEILKLEIENCKNLLFNSDEYWECLIRHLTSSMHEVGGTCKMGAKDDVLAVVDEKLKVHGVKGVRVADSSIFPFMVKGSASVVAVMIGERVSDFIKEEWRKNHDEL